MQKQLEPNLLKLIYEKTKEGHISVDDLLPRMQTVVRPDGDDEKPIAPAVPNSIIGEITAEFRQRTNALLNGIVDSLNYGITDCSILHFVGAARMAVEKIRVDFLTNPPQFVCISVEIKEAESGKDMYGHVSGIVRNLELQEAVQNGQNEWAELLLASKLTAAVEKFKKDLLCHIRADVQAAREKFEQARCQLEEKTNRRRELKYDPGTGKRGGTKEAEFMELTRDIGYLTGCDAVTEQPLKLDGKGKPVAGILESSEEDLKKRRRVEDKVKNLTFSSFLQHVRQDFQGAATLHDEIFRRIVAEIGIEGEPSLASADEVRAYASILNKYVGYMKSRLLQNQAYLQKYGMEQAFQNLNSKTIAAEIMRDMDMGVSFASPEPVVLPSAVVPDTQRYGPVRGKLDRIKRGSRVKIMLALAAVAAVVLVFSKGPNKGSGNYEKRRRVESALQRWNPESHVDIVTVHGERKIRVSVPSLPKGIALTDEVTLKWKFPRDSLTLHDSSDDGSLLFPFDKGSLIDLHHTWLVLTMSDNALNIPPRSEKARLLYSDEMAREFETARLSRFDMKLASDEAKSLMRTELLHHPLIVRYGLTQQDKRQGDELQITSELYTPEAEMPAFQGLMEDLFVRITPPSNAAGGRSTTVRFLNIGTVKFGSAAPLATMPSYTAINGIGLDEFMKWISQGDYAAEITAGVFWRGTELQVNMSGDEIGYGVRFEQDAILEELIARIKSGAITQEMLKNNRREVISRIVKDLLTKDPFKMRYPDCNSPLVRGYQSGEPVLIVPDFLAKSVSFLGVNLTASHNHSPDMYDGGSGDFALLKLQYIHGSGFQYDEKIKPTMPACGTLDQHPISVGISTKAAGTLRFEDAVHQGLIAVEVAGKRK